MDETLLHAATVEDIFQTQIYGDVVPSFTTEFTDNDIQIHIGVFLRPYLIEMLRRLSPHFDICVYTASEKVYANAILDKVDPKGQYLFRRIYRDKCTRAQIDGGRQVYLKDLRCI